MKLRHAVRFTVIEAWLGHLARIEVRVEPPKVEDSDWRWHIGLDRESSRILNALHEARPLAPEEMRCIVGQFRVRIPGERAVIERVKGRPIYLGLAMTAERRVRMTPQNLLANLPHRAA